MDRTEFMVSLIWAKVCVKYEPIFSLELVDEALFPIMECG